MSKLVILNLTRGTLESGFPLVTVVLQEGNSHWRQFQGSLPAAPNIINLYRRWQLLYDLIYEARSINIGLRLSPLIDEDISIDEADVTNVSDAEFYGVCEELQNQIDNWLDTEGFRNIDRQLRIHLSQDDKIRVIIQTEDNQLRKLPWHTWRFFTDYPLAEVGLSPIEFEPVIKVRNSATTVRILAILGDSTGIDVDADKKLLSNLSSDAETVFLVEPKRLELDEQLWDKQGWDILFFAGHSFSKADNETGHIYINPTESLTISQLRNALKKAIERGLQLAIFNSCDGLGLAHQLDDLHIPQIIVMREPVPDRVAQEFLKHFLREFVEGQSFYLAVRQAREKLQGLESDFPCASWLPAICQNPAHTPLTWAEVKAKQGKDTGTNCHRDTGNISASSTPSRRHPALRILGNTLFVTSIAVTALVCGVRHQGVLQPLELQAFDQMTQMGRDEGPDPRLLVVAVAEEDLQYQEQLGMERKGSLSDAALAQILAKLEPLKPSAIALDIYHDFPVQPMQAALAKQLRENNNFFAICKHKDPEINHPGIAPPKEVPKDGLGFSDVVTDDDGILRRQLLHITPNLDSPCPTENSLSLQLALHYLNSLNQSLDIIPKPTKEGLQLGHILLPILTSHWGGYQRLENSGYQMVLRYRSRQIARTVTLTQVLQGDFDPNWVKGRIVLIGTTAPSYKDDIYTPYSLNRKPEQSMRGVFVQAQMVSQIISAFLEGRPLLRVWTTWAETFWMWGWSLVGGGIALYFKKRLVFILMIGLTVCIVFATCFGFFVIQGTWIPLIPTGFTIITTASVVVAFKTSQYQ